MPPRSKLITKFLSPFSRGDLNKAPLESLKKVKIDSYLISLGLLSQHYGVKTTFGQSFWKRSHQLVIYWLEWIMFIKWFICSIMPEDFLPVTITGDFTAYLKGDSFNYHFVLVFWSAIGAISCSLFTMARDHPKLNLLWLQPFELCKGTVKHEEMKIEVEEASDFWQRVVFTLWTTKLVTRVLFLIFIGYFTYHLTYNCPKAHLEEWSTIFWIVVTILWLYYTISIQFGVMAVFHMLCHYFIVKFRKLNELVKELETNPRLDLMTVHNRINHYMNFHNSYAKELAFSNKFWQYYMAMDFVIYITIICFFIELLLFYKMSFIFQMLSLTIILAFLFFLVFISFSAAAVSDEIHESYCVLNAVSQNNMPLVLKTQLQIYIQRIGGPTMGFSCWDLFTVTYDGFFQALLMIGSFFLLFMDVTQSEKKKRMAVPQIPLDSVELPGTSGPEVGT